MVLPGPGRTGRKGGSMFAPHVLIIGGGVQGLWLLDVLRANGLEAVLLERRSLGGQQTCHSHVYIHRGHMYNAGQESLVARLAAVDALWREWCAKHPHLTVEANGSCFGYQNPTDAEDKAAFWESLGLDHDALHAVPEAIRDGVVASALLSPEYCLNGNQLTATLAAPHAASICRIDSVDAIRVDGRRGKIEEVLVRVEPWSSAEFRPGAVVLAAGAGNQALLDLAGGGARTLQASVRDRQQVRKAHMLVVAGEDGVLPRLRHALVLPKLRGLFIVPRRSGGDNVWLVSDDRSPDSSLADDWIARGAQGWLPEVLAALRALAPVAFSEPERLRWGIYDGPKAEGRATGGVPHEERIERFRGIADLWAVWPTKLSLAPLAARQVLKELTGSGVLDGFQPQGMARFQRVRRDPPVAPERWTVTPMMTWEQFRACYADPGTSTGALP